ncbi:MAG: peptidogalycan biosysnthesis protein [Lysobacterales bacterium]
MKKLSARECSVEVVPSIKVVDRIEWDAMALDVYMSYGWLRIIEESFLDPVEHRYFLARANGRLVGGVACHIHQKSQDVFTLDDSIFGRFKYLANRLGWSILPSLICGPLRAYGQHFIFEENLDSAERQMVASALFDALEREADDRSISITFNNVMAGEPELLDLLKRRGFSKTVNFPLNYLEIRWQNPAEYRKFLAKRKLVREINKNRKEGVEISQLDPVDTCKGRLHELLDENYMKYNGKPLPVSNNFVSLCKNYLGSEATVYVAEKKGEIVGTIIMFHRNAVAYVTDVGVDHRATGNDFTYFNLAYYRPVSDAIVMKMNRIYYGTMMYRMKAQRGCETTEIYLYHRPMRRLFRWLLVPLFAVHRLLKGGFIKWHYF